MSPLLEIAVDSIEDAISAAQAGADRLELVSDLAHHGLTPSTELLRDVKSSVQIPVMAMLRPAHDESVVTAADLGRMLDAAEGLLAAGADGIVFGAITPDAHVDRNAVAILVRIATRRQTVFHRAFDLIDAPLDTIETLADLGVTRILSAGMEPHATRSALGLPARGSRPESPFEQPTASSARSPLPVGEDSQQIPADSLSPRIERLRSLVEHARGRIEILPAGGVRPENVRRFVNQTGAAQVHSSARRATHPRLDPDIVRSLRLELDRC